jgi:hypothetical protein
MYPEYHQQIKRNNGSAPYDPVHYLSTFRGLPVKHLDHLHNPFAFNPLKTASSCSGVVLCPFVWP